MPLPKHRTACRKHRRYRLKLPCAEPPARETGTPELALPAVRDVEERPAASRAGAGGAAHLPGMIASKTRIPVIGVPVKTDALSGVDSLYSILQMPRGYPVATMAIGSAGAKNAGLMAASILALQDGTLADRLETWRNALSVSVPEEPSDA